MYQLDVNVDASYAPDNTSLKVFYHEGKESVVFLFLNESGMVIDCRVSVNGYET